MCVRGAAALGLGIIYNACVGSWLDDAWLNLNHVCSFEMARVGLNLVWRSILQ